MTDVRIGSVSIAYDTTTVVTDISMDVPTGSWVTLIGPNGAGKSTLIKSIAGLVDFSGDISFGDRSSRDLSRRNVAQAVAYVPQRPFMPMSMTVVDYVLMGRTPYIPYFGSEGHHDLDVVATVIERMELSEFEQRPIGSLSGGEAQRVVLARALAQESPVLLLDEPTSALDIGHQQQVLDLVDRLRREHSLTVISAMHDLTLAGQFADMLVLMDGGVAVATGTASEVLTENLIGKHYGASVKVIRDPSGDVFVVPTRTNAYAVEGAMNL